MAKYQATYRAAGTMSDEYVEQLKADVKSVGSFSDFVNELYEKYRKGTLEGSAPKVDAPQPAVTVDVEAPELPIFDASEIIEAIQKSKDEIVAEISKHIAAPVAPAPAPVAPVALDTSNLVTHDAMSAHKADIIREVISSREKELDKLDRVLEAIEHLMPEPGDGNVMLTAEPKAVRSDDETPDTLEPVELMGEEEMSAFMDSLADEVFAPEEENIEEDSDAMLDDISSEEKVSTRTAEADEDEELPLADDDVPEEPVLTEDDLDYEVMLGLEELFD